jgi:hypothetical protein
MREGYKECREGGRKYWLLIAYYVYSKRGISATSEIFKEVLDKEGKIS